MRRRGFSLFETIIYFGLLAVITGILTSFMISILRHESKAGAVLEAEQNARFGLERMRIAISNAKTATEPGVGLGGQVLSLTMADALKSPTVFALAGGVLTMKEGMGPAVPITSAGVRVTALSFQNLLDPIANQRTEPMVVPCQDNQNKRLICHNGNTQCVSKNAKLAEGDGLGPCFVVTSAKSTVRIALTVNAPADAGASNDFKYALTVYDTINIPRQN